MQNSTTENNKYCKELVSKLTYARYLQIAFAPTSMQPKLYALFALDCELRHVHHAVSEEMIGHIRYAWWAESVVAYDKKHPVIEALQTSNWPPESLEKLIDCYRDAYPEMPKNADEILDSIVQFIGERRFYKAGGIIRAHKGGKLTLLVKLLFV